MSKRDPNFRPACRRCKGTGIVKGHRVVYAGAHGGCYSCGGRGYLPSHSDNIESAREKLAACADYGKALSADRFTKPHVLEAARNEYRRLRADLRALQAQA